MAPLSDGVVCGGVWLRDAVIASGWDQTYWAKGVADECEPNGDECDTAAGGGTDDRDLPVSFFAGPTMADPSPGSLSEVPLRL